MVVVTEPNCIFLTAAVQCDLALLVWLFLAHGIRCEVSVVLPCPEE